MGLRRAFWKGVNSNPQSAEGGIWRGKPVGVAVGTGSGSGTGVGVADGLGLGDGVGDGAGVGDAGGSWLEKTCGPSCLPIAVER